MTELEQLDVWRRQLAECDTLADFNRYVVPVMRSEPLFAIMAATEAKRRGYRADKTLGIYIQPVEMKLTKGRNLIRVGWSQGVLHCEFASGPKVYTYPNVPQEDYFKLCRSMYPDKLWAIYKKRYAEAQH